jgi:hypothetical protein
MHSVPLGEFRVLCLSGTTLVGSGIGPVRVAESRGAHSITAGAKNILRHRKGRNDHLW